MKGSRSLKQRGGRQVTVAVTILQPLDQFYPQCAIQPLLSLNGHADELHAELISTHPFDGADFNREGRRLMV